jgi:transposase-like protein
MKLTKTQEKYYLKHKGQRCPFCEGDNISATNGFNADGDEITQEVSCEDCKHTWTDLYKLQGILIPKEK